MGFGLWPMPAPLVPSETEEIPEEMRGWGPLEILKQGTDGTYSPLHLSPATRARIARGIAKHFGRAA
jgi:hypothetical protein